MSHPLAIKMRRRASTVIVASYMLSHHLASKPCPIETSNNFGGQSTKIGGHTQNYTDLWRKLNADQTGCRMGHGRQRSLLVPGRCDSEWRYRMALRMPSCSDPSYLPPLPSEALANLNQAGQNASYPGLGTVIASSGMDQW